MVKKDSLKPSLGIFLLLLICGVIVYASYQLFQIYSSMRHSYEVLFDLSDKQMQLYNRYFYAYHKNNKALLFISQELTSTRELLRQTEVLLQEVEKKNREQEGVPVELSGLKEENRTLKETVAKLEGEKEQISQELLEAKSNAAYMSEDVTSLEQGRKIIGQFKKKIRAVKNKMSQLQREARKAKEEAQRQRDYLESQYGNKGYAVYQGVAQKLDGLDLPEKKDVRINVKFDQP